MKDISHIGVARRSGRYPWGSGENPYQRNRSLLNYIDDLKKKGLTETEIAKGMGMNTTQLRAKKSIARAENRKADVAQVRRLKDKGFSNVAIGERMGVNESTVRSLLNPTIEARTDATRGTADILKKNVIEKGYIDVGAGVERHMGVSRTKLNTAIAMLEEEGYKMHYLNVEQLGTGKMTSLRVLADENTPWVDINANKDKIGLVNEYSYDGGRSYLGLEEPTSLDSKRILIKTGAEGAEKDGVIEVRPGVADISLGDNRYAQARVAVDGKYFMKGMVMYNPNMPDGVDVIYNSNKPDGTPPEKVFKTMKNDPDNPFGSNVKQKHYVTEKGRSIEGSPEMLRMKQSGVSYSEIGEKMGVPENTVREAIGLSALNLVNEEGEWARWSRNISSQVLSKQNVSLAKKQLDLAHNIIADEYSEITSLTNPVVKKTLLDAFADKLDSDAEHLKAAALPRQNNHVILPFPGMKDNEVYAPNYRDGERVVLIRHPHGGTFEIPELTVNNKYPPAKKLLGNAPDAIGINNNVAQRLSGADFDGDTVIVIPNNQKPIKTSAPLKGLEDFDPISAYPPFEGLPRMQDRTKQLQMGNVSNLITDMTIKGAPPEEIARAVRHSMVVIDAEKHHLNWKQSELDNGIAQLKKKYQGKTTGGASTLVSRASSQARVGVRKESIDPSTGKKIYTYTDDSYVNKQGKTIVRTVKSTKMAETDDAFTLSSGTPMETVYANHANKLKSLANQSRKESISTKPKPYSPSAKKVYANEVSSLDSKLNVALKNAPLERRAQILANTVVSQKRKADPNLEPDQIKKIKGQALAEARTRTGAKKTLVDIQPREWEAIQAGAISTSKLTQILNNTDLDAIKKLATPRTSTTMTPAKINKAKSMLNSGYTQSEIADALGVSTITIANLDQL